MKQTVALILVGLALSGCLQIAVSAAGLALQSRALYCESMTNEAKQAIADKLTEGQRLVACPARR